ASFVDLHTFLPTGFAVSYAYSIVSNGDVAGTAITTMGVSRAVLWRRILLSLLRLNLTAVPYSQPVIATVALNYPASAKGIVVKPGPVSGPYARTPESVTIPAGKTQASFTIRTDGDRPSAPVDVVITAAYDGEVQKAILTIKP